MVQVLKGVHAIDLAWAQEPLECHLLNCDEGAVLVDTGMEDSAIEKIESELKSVGKSWGDIKVCLLTHKHVDHVRNLRRVKALSGAEAMAHEDDVKDIENVTGVRVKALKDGDILPYCGGIRVVHVPGHCGGNCCFYLPMKKVIIAGDTLVVDPPDSIRPPSEKYCENWTQAKQEIRRLLDYDFDVLLVSHGNKIMKNARARVAELVRKMEST